MSLSEKINLSDISRMKFQSLWRNRLSKIRSNQEYNRKNNLRGFILFCFSNEQTERLPKRMSGVRARNSLCLRKRKKKNNWMSKLLNSKVLSKVHIVKWRQFFSIVSQQCNRWFIAKSILNFNQRPDDWDCCEFRRRNSKEAKRSGKSRIACEVMLLWDYH